ncbi:hypothetical protein Bb109J_c2401 [Bdellovibrio bacteriovorus]|uniref:NnrS family protein n=2 Tax=Bdellovibrio bacteriovorus TaxID=959 RepID=Q6MK20_BDEBA|nr:hypothetical protein B9G79_06325 [Bdellovibrio bacteriovorus]BEV68981.1 hypothetical protein Bb109J_c2401 [Bdellovibrio bacteriovorus]CAE80389.1 hypothetical protein predicted by Glimmer/Critica [Bdellovibrio bacteriovorus HD100]
MNTTSMDAYRYFFPAGWVMAVWGVLLWILFPWNLVTYPGLHHPEIMSGGFFLCFVAGFLMTAAPKFTASFGPTKNEQRASLVLIGLLFASLIPGSKTFFYFTVTALFVFLITYMARRFLNRKNNPPDSFLFVGVGLGAGLVGSLTLLLGQFVNVPSELYQLARTFFLQAYVLCLVMGVGSRLIPALLGWAPLPTESSKYTPQIKLYSALAVAFLGSFVLEVLVQPLSGQILRALVMSFIVFKFWKLHHLPQRRAFQSWWLWGSAWMLLLGQWGTVAFLDFRVHLLHVILVSGLGLMTFMIATRVTLSHGKHDMIWEKNSKGLFLGALLMGFAGLTRLSAGFAPHIYQSHLVYAAYTWILGLIVWGWLFLPKMIRVKA